MKNNRLLGILISALFAGVVPSIAQDFHFDSSIARPVLENYLTRSIFGEQFNCGMQNKTCSSIGQKLSPGHLFNLFAAGRQQHLSLCQRE
jgi:hypothetical protein